jgi:hypothetical protein
MCIFPQTCETPMFSHRTCTLEMNSDQWLLSLRRENREWNIVMIYLLDSPSVTQRKRSILTIEQNRDLQLLLFRIGKIHGFNTMTSAFDSASAI